MVWVAPIVNPVNALLPKPILRIFPVIHLMKCKLCVGLSPSIAKSDRVDRVPASLSISIETLIFFTNRCAADSPMECPNYYFVKKSWVGFLWIKPIRRKGLQEFTNVYITWHNIFQCAIFSRYFFIRLRNKIYLIIEKWNSFFFTSECCLAKE